MKPLVCRLNPRFWAIVILAFLVSLALIFGPSRSQPPEKYTTILAALVVGIFGLLTTIYLAADLARGEVRADDTGLQWQRGLRARKSARWEEISDFYVHLTANGTHFIETPAGKLGVDTSFVGIHQILELVPQRAVNARARDWEMRSYRRDEEWQQTLKVWTKAQFWTAPLISGALVISVGGLAILSSLEQRPSQPPIGFLWDSLVPLLALTLFAGPLAALFGWTLWAMWRERKFAWEHRDETLTMNARGLVFDSEQKRVEATWDEIQSVERTENKGGLKGYRVTTRNGEFVHWANNHLFRARCESYAPDALEPLRCEDAQLSLDSELKPAPIAADGAQTFSFRTRANRLILLCVLPILGFAPFIYLISVYNNATDEPFAPSWLLFGALCVLAFVVSGAAWLWFARASVVADDEGLQLHWPLCSPRVVRWDEIEASGADAWGLWVRANGRKIYWARALFPARRDELNALIEERVRAKF